MAASNEKILTTEKGEKIKVNTLDVTDLKQDGTTTSGHRDFYHQANLFDRYEYTKGIFTQRFRYGILNPYENITTAREILFFTKPDLNIQKTTMFNDGDRVESDQYGPTGLHKTLENYSFFTELKSKMPGVLDCLQSSAPGNSNPFNNLLGNMVQSNLDIPATTADMIETPANVYGVSYKYRGSSEAGDDNHTFSLEFKDTKYLPVYHFFKAYDMYEIFKHHGLIRPKKYYISNKILHDQYSIYKFLLDEDMETIIYYAKYYGVKSVNLPRDVFNTTTFDNGISYSIDFDAAFVEDMNPQILSDFNQLAYSYWKDLPYHIPVFNKRKAQIDMRTAQCAVVAVERANERGFRVLGTGLQVIDETSSIHNYNKIPGRFVYKLKWKGDQEE